MEKGFHGDEQWSEKTAVTQEDIMKVLDSCYEKCLNGILPQGPVDKLKRNGFLYGIHIISIAGGHFYDGKTKRTNPNGNS